MLERIHAIRATVAILLSVALLLPGCAPGTGIPIGPFPIDIDLGEGLIDADALGAAAGKRGTAFIPVPLCGLPTRAEASAKLEELAGETSAPFVELDEIILTRVELSAVEGDFSGLDAVELYYQPPPEGLFPSLPVLVAAAAGDAAFGDTIELMPVDNPNILRLMDDAEKQADGCVTVYLRVTGTVPDAPITWSGILEADVFGLVRI